jgi:hypothetical protein
VADSLENLTPEQRAELNIGRLTKQLLTDPETREQAAQLLQRADKTLRFPDVDAKAEARKLQEKAQEKIRELEQRIVATEARSKLEKYHAKIRDAGLDVKLVNELMEKHGLAMTDENYDFIIDHIQSKAQVAEPTTEGIQPFRIPDIKEMWNDPVKWREEQGHKVLNELIAQRRRA